VNTGRYFIAGLFAFGIVVGIAIARFPQLEAVPLAALTLPLLLSLLIDLALLPLARKGRAEPPTMEQRFIGVIGSALIATGIVALAR
jgi:hypothetical protein